MTKKTTVVLAIALLPVLGAAEELKPGTIQVTGASILGFESGSVDQTLTAPGVPDVKVKTDVSTFGVEAGALYYLTPMIGVGLDLGWASKESKLPRETTTTTDAFVGPKVGLDVGVAEKLSVFGDLAVGWAKARVKFTDSLDPTANYDDDGSGWGYRIGAGIKYFAVPALSVDLGLGYRAVSVSFTRPNGEKVKTDTSGFGGMLGLSVYFGR